MFVFVIHVSMHSSGPNSTVNGASVLKLHSRIPHRLSFTLLVIICGSLGILVAIERRPLAMRLLDDERVRVKRWK